MVKIVRYTSDIGHFDGLAYGKLYKAISENEEQYIIYPNDLGDKSSIRKDKFDPNVFDIEEHSSVDVRSDCYVFVKHDWVPAKFVGVFQRSKIIEPSIMRGGDRGGIIHFPITMVIKDNALQEFAIHDVRFTK